MVPWTHVSQLLKRRLDRCSRFCSPECPTHRHADHATCDICTCISECGEELVDDGRRLYRARQNRELTTPTAAYQSPIHCALQKHCRQLFEVGRQSSSSTKVQPLTVRVMVGIRMNAGGQARHARFRQDNTMRLRTMLSR